MWRLKIGEGSGPWLQSANGFLGRQVWEFDRDAGTPEERAEVERLREDFTKHRYHKRESQDLLLRLQFAKGNLLPANIPTTRIEKGTQVTEKMIATSLRRALNQYSTLQAHDGQWPGDLSGIMFIMPVLNKDGGWGTHVWGPSNMFGSCLNYATLRLLGERLDNDNDSLTKGRDWILSHGSATAVPQWGKIFLSIIGVYDWSGNNPIIPELWLLPYFLPIHPGRFWCFCRLVYMSMAYIYGKKFVGPITPTIMALREELYNVPYDDVDWGKACNYCAKEDLHNLRSQVQNIVLVCLNKFVAPVLNWWPANKLRGRALSKLMEQIHYNNETTEYLTICPVDKALNMICCWVENPNSDAFKKHLPRVYDYLWIAEDGMKAKIYDGCQSWETPFIVQAIFSTDLIVEFSPIIKKAHDFMKKSQILGNFPDYESFYRHRSKGSWTLSTIDNGWSISDCTAETLKALLSLSKISPNLVGDPIEEQRLYDAIDFLLSLMNTDGSFSAYERRRTTAWLELLNPSESFKNIVIDYPSTECTASTVDALVLFKDLYPQYRSEEIGKCIESDVKFVEGKQLNDGSWYSSWGICFTYGTLFAVKGLAAAGRNYYNSSSIRKACKFLLSKQQSTGGWGESYLSNYTEEYVDSGTPHTVETAWAMLGLIYGGQEHVGCSNNAFYFNYPNYRNLFPIMALGEFHRRLVANKNSCGCT